MTVSKIIALLPYQKPFLFVDGIDEISDEGITGHYTFNKNEIFYEGHFKNNPITPGVILTECMAQIGLVCLGIYLLRDELSFNSVDSERSRTAQKPTKNKSISPQIALTAHQMDFYLPVLPEEKVTVISEKEVFRFNKLKCKLKMLNEKGELVARGLISGMLKV